MRRLTKSLLAAAGIVVVVLLALISNLSIRSPAGTGTRITTTFFPLYDWARNVAGTRAAVRNLTPSGTDPHDVDPTPEDISAIISSTVFVHSGRAGMEPWLEKVLPTIDKTKTTVVDASLGVNLILGQAGYPDPHFWLDPVAAVTAVENIELGLEKADPGNAAYYRQNAQIYIGRLNALRDAFVANLTTVRIRNIITFHESFGYWKRAYNLTEAGIYGFEPEGEPSAAHMQELVTLAKKNRITTVLASNLDDPRWCQVLSDQIGGKVLVLDPLEGPTSEQEKTGKYNYIDRLYYDITVLKTALV
ncbi:MAG: zinc ABC transporter substrate-binding protein [archaeon]